MSAKRQTPDCGVPVWPSRSGWNPIQRTEVGLRAQNDKGQMVFMSTIYRENALSSGRVGQKIRTRNQLLEAARDLMTENEPVTVASVAQRAGISTATAYRYFADPQELKLEAVIDVDAAEKANLINRFDAISGAADDPVDRVIIANQLMLEFVRSNEPGMRLFLAKFNERKAAQEGVHLEAVPLSQRVELIERALAPARGQFGMAFKQVCNAVLAACGPEVYLILKDVAQLEEAQIERTMSSNLRAIVNSYR